jgi:site-specific DNA-methyltransferase (adenine-specific)
LATFGHAIADNLRIKLWHNRGDLKPYYQENGITIYHGDCGDVVPVLQEGMVIVTDQPYGTGWRRGGQSEGVFISQPLEQPEWDKWNLEWLRRLPRYKRIAAFAPIQHRGKLCEVLERPTILYYRKSNVRPLSVDWEPIVVSPAVYPLEIPIKTVYNGDTPHHPCQKPLELMKWVISYVSDKGDTILDPFMGSGTTLIAAKDLGHPAIGIEIEERYCEIAANRLRQGVLDFEGHARSSHSLRTSSPLEVIFQPRSRSE